LTPFAPDDDALFDREPVVEAERLVLGRAGEPLLEAPHFALREGGCAVLEGDAGGVHAFLDAVRLLRPARSGSLRLFGRDARKAGLRARARLRGRIAFAGPSAALAPGLSLLENIALPLRLAGVTPRAYRDAVEELILDLALTAEAKTLAARASPPARRAAALARAIAARPALLIADNPLAGLAAGLETRALAVLGALQAERTALLFAGLPEAAAEALHASRHAISGGTLRAARELAA